MLQLTIEQVPRGAPPAWLVEHAVTQSLDVRTPSQGGPSRIMVVHPSSAALEEFLDAVAVDCPVIDRTSHQTLQGLARKLHADLRQPRLLSAGGATSLALDAVMRESAAELAFPILHPIPDMQWSGGKSAILLEMHAALQQEAVFDEWDGPGVEGVSRAIDRIEEALQGRHPDRHLPVLCDLLDEAEEKPFSLVGLDGIVLLDRAPGAARIEARLFESLRRHLPIHQLCHAGSHRLGLHGWTMEDIHPVTSTDSLPDWLPEHAVVKFDPASVQSQQDGVHRLLLQRAAHAIPVAARLLARHLASAGVADGAGSASPSAIVIDPGLDARRDRWATALAGIGVSVPRGARPLCSSPFVHWIERFAELPHGEAAFDLERLRSLSVQRVLQPFDASRLADHPSIEGMRPVADAEMLEQVARNHHLLAGPGALRRWLEALARETDADARGAARREQTQWWLLALVRSLRPLLRPEDRQAIDEPRHAIGCVSREPLPLPRAAVSGSGWLRGLLRNIDRRGLVQRFDGDEDLAMRGLQQLFGMVEAHRADQLALTLVPPEAGLAWVEEMVALIADAEMDAPAPVAGSVRLLKPNEALGCTADLVIIAHVEADSWSMRVPKVPLLDEESRAELDVLRPDGPIRAARHNLAHLIEAARTAIVLDPSLDESAPPAGPIAEWLRSLPTGSPEQPLLGALPDLIPADEVAAADASAGRLAWQWQRIDQRIDVGALVHETDLEIDASGARIEEHVHGVEARDQRQRDGVEIHAGRTPERLPLATAALSVVLDRSLMADRIARQPSSLAPGRDYQDAADGDRIVTIQPHRIVPKATDPKGSVKPRAAPDWPPIGGRLTEGGQTMTIDPRPLRPHDTGLAVLDERNGASQRPTGDDPPWSPSGLRKWQECPRQGWLDRRLKATDDETLKENLDARTRGTLIHDVYELLLCRALGLSMHRERTTFTPASLARASSDDARNMGWALEALADNAGWLERRDVTAESRLLDFTGMNNQGWLDWLATSGDAHPLGGRLGAMLVAEHELADACVLALEWMLADDSGPAVIELPGSGLPPLEVNGSIDRVDLVPFDLAATVWVDDEGDMTTAPLAGVGPRAESVGLAVGTDSDLADATTVEAGASDDGGESGTGGDWRPRRLVVIRDMKTKEGSSGGEKHLSSLYDDLQLAVYARAWEVQNAGDLVIGVGVSEIGLSTTHHIEFDGRWRSHIEEMRLGQQTESLDLMHRLPGESVSSVSTPASTAASTTSPPSEPFRAWLYHRLHVACSIVAAAAEGLVNPTPGDACSYCSVKAACGLDTVLGGWKR